MISKDHALAECGAAFAESLLIRLVATFDLLGELRLA
jgi:hypothetical protein